MTFLEIQNAESIAILGFGREGQATYRFLRKRHPDKTLLIADKYPIDDISMPNELRVALKADQNLLKISGSAYLSSTKNADVIIKSPGIFLSALEIDNLVQAGARITSQTSILFSNYPRDKIVGITGTKGKSTTSSLIWSMLSIGGINACLLGNIGIAPLAAFDRDYDILVCELSSFQLNDLNDSPHISVLLNIVPEHLDYHGSFDKYIAAKSNIAKFQTPDDYLICGYDHHLPRLIAAESKATQIFFSNDRHVTAGCFLQGSEIFWSNAGQQDRLFSTEDVPLLGRFNILNVMAATCVAKLLSVPTQGIRSAVREFRPLKHRLQFVGQFRGIDFYDDSISTVPASTLAAIQALSRVSVLIAGGHDRNLDFTEFGRQLADSSVEALVLFPGTGEKIWKSICDQKDCYKVLPQVRFVASMREAVESAFELASSGTICLLSPASPSFGLFKDFEERGNQFAKEVRAVSIDKRPFGVDNK